MTWFILHLPEKTDRASVYISCAIWNDETTVHPQYALAYANKDFCAHVV